MEDSESYDHAEVEKRWQNVWREEGVFEADDDADGKRYVLGMFPYPSGKLHMGHVRNYTITDAYARYRRLRGDEVLHPMGWDSFGLPAENAAIERDTNPRDWTFECVETMRDQMEAMGFGYDWDREVTTCEPEYYRWNQWMFKRFADEGLAEYNEGEVNWCPGCETVLANEQVEDGACWRCDSVVEERALDQWYLNITEYAGELLDGLGGLDGWPESVKQMQRNWIGRQEGATVPFEVEEHGDVDCFTTRLDTLFGATFVALAPEHPVAEAIAEENDDVAGFIESVDPDREPGGEKRGIDTGLRATSPANGEEVPVYVANFVLTDVGTGAIMSVPAHDERDHEFAKEHDIPIRQVIEPLGDEELDTQEEAFTEDGVVTDSGGYDGMKSEEARRALTEDIDGAEGTVEYRLRDWLISRQRYWGTPIPVVHCEDCGPVFVPDEDMPVELPEFVQTSGNPLEESEDFVDTDCPECGKDARRETDTMDTFFDSSWYFLRYATPGYEDAPFEDGVANEWTPVDHYVGGIEHAIMHLLYARFFTRVLNDMGMVERAEPFEELVTQGMVLLDGEKMSKSKGNVVSPQRIVEEYGADTARLFMMSAALPEKDFDWTESGVESNHTFLKRLHRAVEGFDGEGHGGGRRPIDEYVGRKIDATVEDAAEEYDDFRFNFAVRASKDLVSTLEAYAEHTEPDPDVMERGLRAAVIALSPVTPHIAEELWESLGCEGMVAEAEWMEAEAPDGYKKGTRLVETTREDVREIRDVADIDGIEDIRVVVAPEWKHRALEIAVEADDDVMGAIMSEDEVRRHGDEAAAYGRFLQKNHRSLEGELGTEREKEALERARWLFEKEFDASVTVERAENSDSERAEKARPGKPAIEIE